MSPEEALAAARPRVEGKRETEILDATLGLLRTVGYDKLTFDAIATAAKASKATLYRRWDNKGDLVIDAVLRAKEGPQNVIPNTGTLRGDLIASTCHDGGLSDDDTCSVFIGLITALHHDEEFAHAFRTRFLGPVNETARVMFERAVERGEIDPSVDIDLLMTTLPALVMHRVSVLRLPTGIDLITRMIDEIVLPAATRKAYQTI